MRILLNTENLTYTQTTIDAPSTTGDQVVVDLEKLLPNYEQYLMSTPVPTRNVNGEELSEGAITRIQNLLAGEEQLQIPAAVLLELIETIDNTPDYAGFVLAYLADDEIDDHLTDLAVTNRASRQLMLLTSLILNLPSGEIDPDTVVRRFSRFLARIDVSAVDIAIVTRLDALFQAYKLPFSVVELLTA